MIQIKKQFSTPNQCELVLTYTDETGTHKSQISIDDYDKLEYELEVSKDEYKGFSVDDVVLASEYEGTIEKSFALGDGIRRLIDKGAEKFNKLRHAHGKSWLGGVLTINPNSEESRKNGSVSFSVSKKWASDHEEEKSKSTDKDEVGSGKRYATSHGAKAGANKLAKELKDAHKSDPFKPYPVQVFTTDESQADEAFEEEKKSLCETSKWIGLGLKELK
jgi:hypothetical protein